MQVNYFHFVAEEVRAGLAALGLRSMDELVGRADLLKQRDIRLAKTTGLDLSFITTFAGPIGASSERYSMTCTPVPTLPPGAGTMDGRACLLLRRLPLPVLHHEAWSLS